jgi:hypothetical protein
MWQQWFSVGIFPPRQLTGLIPIEAKASERVTQSHPLTKKIETMSKETAIKLFEQKKRKDKKSSSLEVMVKGKRNMKNACIVIGQKALSRYARLPCSSGYL